MNKPESKGFARFSVLLNEGWQPPIPTSTQFKSKADALARMMQMHASMMMQVSTAISKGQIKSARTRLRALYRRLDAALHQLERLERESR